MAIKCSFTFGIKGGLSVVCVDRQLLNSPKSMPGFYIRPGDTHIKSCVNSPD